jgi:hypothetical protein
MEMCHGESQEEGQEESQEEVVLALDHRRVRVSLTRRLVSGDSARAIAGTVVSGIHSAE